MSDLAAFSAALDAFEDAVVAAINEGTRVIALDLHGRIVQRTPVDTGLARNSWDISPRAVDAPGGGLARSGGRVLFAWEIINTLPYIEALEFGHSKQAPAGMARIALAEIEAEYGDVAVSVNFGSAPL